MRFVKYIDESLVDIGFPIQDVLDRLTPEATVILSGGNGSLVIRDANFGLVYDGMSGQWSDNLGLMPWANTNSPTISSMV